MVEDSLQAKLQGHPFRYYESTFSTMNDARQWLEAEPNLRSGAVVIADEQIGGRGRAGRTWLTPPRTAVAMSVIYRQELPPAQVSMLGGLAVVEVVEQWLQTADPKPAIALKWPNDILVNDKKIAGVLGEALWDGKVHLASILGIGLNVEVDFEKTPLASIATSLHEYLSVQRLHSRPHVQLIIDIMGRLDYWIATTQAAQAEAYGGLAPSPIYTAWRERLSTLGQRITLETPRGAVQGLAVDVREDGALQIQHDDNSLQTFMVGDVRTLRDQAPPQ